jgi:hypothetical protein
MRLPVVCIDGPVLSGPGLVGKEGRDGYAEIDRHLYREEYLQAVDIGHDLGLRLDARSVASAARLVPADATT